MVLWPLSQPRDYQAGGAASHSSSASCTMAWTLAEFSTDENGPRGWEGLDCLPLGEGSGTKSRTLQLRARRCP